MRNVLPFPKNVRVFLNAAPEMPRRGGKKVKETRIVVHIDPVPDYRLRVVMRNVLHGILSSWGWRQTKGLYLEIFERGGTYVIQCKASDEMEIREQIRLRLPDLRVRRVRAA